MNKLLLTALSLMLFSTPTFADVSGFVGYSSDYVFRGKSQSGKPVKSFGLQAETEGLYVGVWGSEVNYTGDTTTRELNYFGGYDLSITDNVSLDVGYIRYVWDSVYDSVEEVYASVSVGGLSITGFGDLDTHETYGELTYKLWFVPLVDAKFIYGTFDKQGKDSYVMLRGAKTINDTTFYMLVGQNVLKNTAVDSLTFGIEYSF
jgi:uncharacterized protein (TIGR02001 family)